MNSNCEPVKITPFRLFDQTASRAFKRKMANRILAALDSVDVSEAIGGGYPQEDAAIAQ
jgi:hypothetical protein